MGIRQWFNNPEEKRALNEVERLWPDLAQWADDATDPRKNKAALDRMRSDAVLRRMYRAAAAKFFRFERLILRVVPGMKLLAAESIAEVIEPGTDDGWASLADQGVYLASRIVGTNTTQPATLWNAFNRAGVRTLIVDIVLTVNEEDWQAAYPGGERLPDRMPKAKLVFTRSGRLDCSAAIDLRCPIEAGPWQIFSLSGNGHVKFFRGGGMCPVVGVTIDTRVAMLRIEGCRFLRCGVGLKSSPGAFAIQPSEVQDCEFVDCPKECVASTLDGLVPNPWLVIRRTEGTSDAGPPASGNPDCRPGCGTGRETMPVGARPLDVSPYGVYDMASNGMEWVMDYFHESYQDAPVDGSAWMVPETAERVMRNGWLFLRMPWKPEYSQSLAGIRCCRDLPISSGSQSGRER